MSTFDFNLYNLDDDIFTPNIGFTSHVITSGDEYLHSHKFYEIFYILEGNIRHKVNDTEEILNPGDIVFLRPFDNHIFLREPGNTCMHRDVMIMYHQFEQACEYIDSSLLENFLTGPKPLKLTLTLAQINYFEETLNNFTNTAPRMIQAKIAKAKGILSTFITILYQNSQSIRQFPSWLNQLLVKMNMIDNFPKGLPAILKYFDYDYPYMCRTFKKFVGMTMTDYLNLNRLNYAGLLLQTSNMSILSIANSVGFNTISHFNNQFKKLYKTTPKEFRRNHNFSSAVLLE